MATRPARRRVTAVLTALGLAAGLAVSAATPAAGAEPPVSTKTVVVPMIFPVVGGASYTDTFLACRSTCERRHLGQDLMTPRMRKLVAAFDGRISYVNRETRVGGGNYFSLQGDNGWSVNYIHANNDRPGTDDGKGTRDWFVLPGVQPGARVFAGQHLGWTGDSGNAESTAPHTHFELRKGGAWDGVVYNPYKSLRESRVLSAPYTSGPHPDGALVYAPRRGAWQLHGQRRYRVLFTDLAVFGWTRQHLITVTPSELLSYPSGGWLPLRDGPVVRDSEGSLWVLANGERVAVPKNTNLAKLGTTAERVLPVSASAIRRTPLAADQTLPGVVRPGAFLVSQTTGRRWYVDGAVRRRVFNYGTARSYGWALASATPVSEEMLSTIPVAAALRLRDGTVFTSPEGHWFVVSNGLRRRVASSVAFKAYGWSRVPRVRATAWSTAQLPVGANLP